jgi:hypothetical protein
MVVVDRRWARDHFFFETCDRRRGMGVPPWPSVERLPRVQSQIACIFKGDDYLLDDGRSSLLFFMFKILCARAPVSSPESRIWTRAPHEGLRSLYPHVLFPLLSPLHLYQGAVVPDS